VFDFLGVRYYGQEISVVSSLAQTDALSKLLIEKGVITQDEFLEKLKAERATYQAMFRQKGN